jgi:predicted HTH transcriptional regulator
MTLHYMQTARLNAKPLARHIDTPKRQAPQFRTQEEYAAAMMADAKRIRQEPMRQTYDEIDPEPIVQAVRENPGITARGIADIVGLDIRQVSAKMCSLENKGVVRSVSTSNGRGRVRSFSIGDGQYHRAPKKSVKELINFIASNPQCTTADIADRFKCSRKSAFERVRAARKWVKIKTEGGKGNKPALFSVEAGE